MNRNKNKSRLIVALFTFVILCSGFKMPTLGKDDLKTQAKIALLNLRNKQKDDGSWRSLFSFDTIPENFNAEFISWQNMIVVDLLKPLARNYDFDSLFIRSIQYVENNFYDASTGLVGFGTIRKEYPKDVDDTGLYWLIAENTDTSLIPAIIDTLLDFRSENGMYGIWLRKNGCKNLRGCGKEPNPVDLLCNIHLYLFFDRFKPKLAKDLCGAFSQNADLLCDLWVYNEKTPWLYYIRQIDLKKAGCLLNWDDFDDRTSTFAGQEIYTEMSKLIRDLALNRNSDENRGRAEELLLLVSENNFEYVKTHPLAMFHNDLTAATPAYFWSEVMPYALWLRLFYEY